MEFTLSKFVNYFEFFLNEDKFWIIFIFIYNCLILFFLLRLIWYWFILLSSLSGYFSNFTVEGKTFCSSYCNLHCGDVDLHKRMFLPRCWEDWPSTSTIFFSPLNKVTSPLKCIPLDAIDFSSTCTSRCYTLNAALTSRTVTLAHFRYSELLPIIRPRLLIVWS